MTSPRQNPRRENDPDRRSARRKARKRALDILFEADVRGTEPLATARDRLAQSDPPVPDYAVTLVEGVTANRARLDELIATYAEGWTIDRMPAVDRSLLRLGIYELLFRDDIPDVVAIDEAVDLARELSTDDSPRFVNGLLGRLQLVKAEL
ncbi:transcription antitermination factor NusB [Cryptosporangium sp. NPDC048952]|uniref:transcription antitermination factor NusB n=1 Tax=Cryptosporangium sp. NPDC048952 TaxID=3363961 RepID=UPI0037177C83